MLLSLSATLVLTALPQASRTAVAVGAKAPELAPEVWLTGAPVAPGAGSILVLDFWSPAVEQCLASEPYLADLARQFGPQGVRVAGVIAPDERTTLEKVQQHFARRTTAPGYAFAWDGASKTRAAYLGAASVQTLPCSFVLDAEGVVAWIGNPMFALEPVAELLAGTWDRAADGAVLAAAENELLTMYALAAVDPKGQLTKLATFEQQHPRLIALTEPLRFELALAAGDFALATTTGHALVERAARVGDAVALRRVADLLVDEEKPPAKPDLELALQAGEKAVLVTASKDYRALTTLATVCRRRGEKERAVELLTQALPLAPPLAKADILDALTALQGQ